MVVYLLLFLVNYTLLLAPCLRYSKIMAQQFFVEVCHLFASWSRCCVVVWSMNTYFFFYFVANSDYFLIEVKQQ